MSDVHTYVFKCIVQCKMHRKCLQTAKMVENVWSTRFNTGS